MATTAKKPAVKKTTKLETKVITPKADASVKVEVKKEEVKSPVKAPVKASVKSVKKEAKPNLNVGSELSKIGAAYAAAINGKMKFSKVKEMFKKLHKEVKKSSKK